MTDQKYFFESQIPVEPDPETGLPIGPALLNTAAARLPDDEVLEGHYCRLEPLNPAKHSDDLFKVCTLPDAHERFQYLPETKPVSINEFNQWMEPAAASKDPKFYAVIDKATGKVEGRQSFLRIDSPNQCIETGHIYWGPGIAGTRVTTEAFYLFAKAVFETWGYRRFEWKCNALNKPSLSAASRFGFSFEGHFRRAVIVRGRSRDTRWFGMIYDDWRLLEPMYSEWLSPSNFDAEGKQKTRLSDMTRTVVAKP